MTSLLVLKEYLKKFYVRNEVYIVPVLKFLLAGLTLLIVNVNLGFMDKINSVAVVLIISLMCSFLPLGFILFFAELFVLLHFYALGIEVMAVAFSLFLVMFLLYFRFASKDILAVLLIPVCFLLKIPYAVPLVLGLFGTVTSFLAIACGTIIYYMVSFVSVNAATLKAMPAEEGIVRFRMVMDSIFGNREMMVVVAAFVITFFVVYFIRRMSMDYSWTIAIIAGAVTDMVILLVGDLIYDTRVSILGVIFGSAVSVILAKIFQFFAFNLDYTRTEKVQFEDDEYYYYVKAVPKITLTTPTKTVKKINAKRYNESLSSRNPRRNADFRTGRPARDDIEVDDIN